MSIPILHNGQRICHSSSPKADTRNLPTKILSSFVISLIMIPVAITAVFFILTSLAIFFVFALYNWFLHRNYRQSSHKSSEDVLSSRCVKSLPQFKFCEAIEYGSHCVICIDGFRQGEWCRKLPMCSHVFHRKCVDMWLNRVGNCPICRDTIRWSRT